ncbi:DNA repair protein RAD51 homolog 2 [Macadamia integrifolia]|uniref:DNA repair protein RAD51 homolog 2 n=1 Tax=Macadamia integrifolia TaxID=60698 RepID=UPI001C52CA03|nr:DNA repair protein RAD51 homolog 2 [Macadamia integrifolia]
MANKLISQMGLPKAIANIFAARNIVTAKDALSLTEFELMELLDVGLAEVTTAVAHISEMACPPYQTALSLMEERVRNECLSGHLPTRLKGLDNALCGGIPFGTLTELVGPAGIGKTQFCLKLSLLAALPASYGGLNGHVIYIDIESKFSSRRLIEIGLKSFPEIFHVAGMAQEMAGRIVVLQPASLAEFTESLQQIKLSILQHQVKLLIIDSMAALVSGEYERDFRPPRQQSLGWHISSIKSLAEFSRIPVVVTNQVRTRNSDESHQYPFQVQNKEESMKDQGTVESHLVAALGIFWAHAVTIRLVLEANLGQRFIKVAKSPLSPPLAFPFDVTSSGISLLSDDGIEVMGPEICTIHCQGLL